MTYGSRNIKAILFDMDGTLVDSERLTEQALLALLAARGIPAEGLDLVQFHGVTWDSIAGKLRQLFPSLESEGHLAGEIETRFQALFQDHPPDMIPGARDAFIAASHAFPGATSIVTSSEARAVELLLDRTDLRSLCTGYTSCDQYTRSKPAPESYLLAASRLGLSPSSCLVFEDSLPGLEAARAAGMACIAITRGIEQRVRQGELLADDVIDDFTDLPQGYFASLCHAFNG